MRLFEIIGAALAVLLGAVPDRPAPRRQWTTRTVRPADGRAAALVNARTRVGGTASTYAQAARAYYRWTWPTPTRYVGVVVMAHARQEGQA